MASEVDICNLALGHLGDRATVASIDPPEGSAQAEHCAHFYPIARDVLLESHAWRFATRRASLSQLAVESFNWSYAYSEPSQALRILAVLHSQQTTDDEGQPFELSGDDSGNSIIFTNTENASVVYTVRVTDTTKYSPLVVDALSRLLASYLAGPILKGDMGKAEAKAQLQLFRVALGAAIVSDANQRKVITQHSVGWMAGR